MRQTKTKTTAMFLVALMGLILSIIRVDILFAQPSNITLTAYDDTIVFDWDETSMTPVNDYIIEFYDGNNWNVYPDGVSATSSFTVPRSAYQNDEAVTVPTRITTEFADMSTSAAISANLTLPPYEKVDFTATAPTTIVTEPQRTAAGLDFWVDGNLGFYEYEGEIYSLSADSSNTARVRKGSSDLLGTVTDGSVSINNQEQANDYIAGGPVYFDAVNDRLYMFYHGEMNSAPGFWSYIGMAYSDDGGESFEDLGQIVTPDIPIGDPDRVAATEIGGGAYAIKDGTFYLYFKETLDDAAHVKLGVATADVADVIAAGELGNKTTWNKWNGTDFATEPGIDGAGADILYNYADAYWMDVAYIDSLDKFVLVYSNGTGGNWTHKISTSTDGIHWIEPENIFSGTTDEILYVSISSPDFANQRNIEGDNFYVYFVRSEEGGSGGFRWDDAWVQRYQVEFDVPVDPGGGGSGGSESDSDNDGISDSVENMAPGQDGNGDGIPDRNQSSVTTVINSVTSSTTTLESTGDCDTVDSFEVLAASDLSNQDAEYQYPYGLNDFSIRCDSPGQTATVKFFYTEQYDDASQWRVRKYVDSAYSDINGAAVGLGEVNGADVTTISYQITDGGSLDEDGLANGEIVDPSGAGSRVLANTGQSPGVSIAVGFGLVILPIVALKSKKKYVARVVA